MAINAGDITWNIGADLKGFQKGVDGASTTADGLAGKLGKHSKAIGVAFTAMGASIVGSIGLSVKSFAEAGDEIQKMSARTGIATETLSEFKFAAERSGTTLQTVEKAVKKMSTVIFEAGDESKKAGVKFDESFEKSGAAVDEAYSNYQKLLDKYDEGTATQDQVASSQEKYNKALAKHNALNDAGASSAGTYGEALKTIGLTVEELRGLNPEEQFLKLAMSISDVADQTTKAAVAQEIFGRAGMDLLPMLQGGSAGLEELRQRARDLGIVFDQEAANKAAKFQDAMLDLKESGKALMFVIATTVVPSLIQFAEWATQAVQRVRQFTNANPILTETLILAAAAIGSLMLVLGPLLVVLPGITAAMGLFTTSTVVAGTAATGASVGIGAMAVAAVSAAVPFIALGAVIAIASASIWENIKATKALGVAVEQEKQSEERLGKEIERGIKRLENKGVAVNRAKIAAMSLDEQQKFLIKTFKENSKQIEAGEKATESSVKTTDVAISKTGENAEATKKGTTAQHNLTNEVVQGTGALARLVPKIDHAAGKYNFLASAARKAESAIRAANAAAAQSGGGGGGGSDSGGGGANGFAGFSGGGGTIGSAPSGFGGFSAGASRGSSSRGAVSVSPSIVVNIDGSGLSASELYAEFEAKLFDSMATNLKIAMG